MRTRIFILAALVVAAVSCSTGKKTYELPDYYDGYFEPRLGEVKESVRIPKNGENFIYFTDSHVIKDLNTVMPGMLYRTIKTLGVKDVIFGGDATMTSPACATKEDVDASWEKTLATSGAVRAAGGNYYPVRGNHEITTGTIMPEHPGFTYSEANIFKIVTSQMVGEDVVMSGDTTCVNYYWDNRKAKIRHIVVDPYSSVPADTTRKYGIGMRYAGLATDWLASSLESMPEGWHAMLFVHQGLQPSTGYSDYNNCRGMRKIVGENPDKFLLVLHGHVHRDTEAFENGVLHVSTTACLPNEDKQNIFCKDERVRGEISETAYDVVSYNPEKATIDMYRIGGGYSRYYNLTPIELTPGATFNVESRLENVDEWRALDSDGLHATSWGNWTDAYWDSDYAVCEGGTVTAVAPGEAVAVAIDNTNKTREYFYIRVVGE